MSKPSQNIPKQEPNLGLAGGTARKFIHSPLSPLLFLVMLGMGLIGLMVTPRQEDPQISVPMIDIFVQFPGANTDQVVNLAIEPLERIMSEIPGVKHVYSAAEREQGEQREDARTSAHSVTPSISSWQLSMPGNASPLERKACRHASPQLFAVSGVSIQQVPFSP